MIKSYTLSEVDCNYLLTLQEVVDAKKRIDLQIEGSVYFNITLTSLLRETIYEKFDLDFSKINSIPLRWIKGDTYPHIDKSSHSFDKTYLAYLTDSPGKLIVDGESYPILKGNAYVFSEGLLHETLGTGSEPRLLLGPMNENGISVGGPYTFNYPGGTTIYIRERFEDPNRFYDFSLDKINWNNFYFSVEVTNNDTSLGLLIIEFTTNITFNGNAHFICNSSHIQFGSSSLNPDGTRPVITIDGVIGSYPGLINNGTNSTAGFSNIYVFNLEVNAINGSSQPNDGGWIGQAYFGKEATNNFIINCSSSGPIIDGGGGIIGGYSGSGSGASLYITGCSSDGNTGVYSGGIIGFYAGYSGGQVICENCWSLGSIYTYAGGIFGFYAGNATGLAQAIKCYSTGAIGNEAGGIFGRDSGYDNGRAIAVTSYSQGVIGTDAGGIFGSYAGSNGGTTSATNCYSSGTITTLGNGIYGSNAVNDDLYNCYVANGSWDTTTANTFLIDGIPNPIVGQTWVATISGQPYELNNMGYSPYTITNISSTPSLVQTYGASVNAGNSSTAAIVSGKSYTILQKSGGDSSSYGTISIDSTTGTISTTSTTIPGIYTLYIRNTGSYNITSFSLTVLNNIVPNPSICFPAGTPVLTDQGEIPIDKIDTKKHTIRGNKIVSITESIPLDSYLICIERNSFGNNNPNRRTFISKDHKIMYRNKMVRSEYLIEYIPGVYKVQYNKERLYNVLLKEHSTMTVNNLIVETMNPNHMLAKIYSGNYTPEQRNLMIKMLNHHNIKQRSKLFIRNNIFRA